MPKCKTCGKGRIKKFFCSDGCKRKFKVAFFAGCVPATNFDKCQFCHAHIPRNYMVHSHRIKSCHAEHSDCRNIYMSGQAKRGPQGKSVNIAEKLERYKAEPNYLEQMKIKAAEYLKRYQEGTLF